MVNICFIPLDNRPVCYTLAQEIMACDKSINAYLPPREIMGGLTTYTDTQKLIEWLKSLPEMDIGIISLDAIAYGGLVASRRISTEKSTIVENLDIFKNVLKTKCKKIFAFSSIMRISNNNYNIEEKEYWSKYGKKIFDYSYHTCKAGKWGMESCIANLIPDDILADYMATRRRNFEINKMYLDWKNEGFFDSLIFSKDDCAEYGFNVDEAKELESLGGETITGADEIPLTLLAKSLDKPISICPIFIEDSQKHLISKYEDVSIENSVIKQARLAGYDIKSYDDADIVLIVNNFKVEQGEIVMKVDTEKFSGILETFIPKEKPYMIADVRFANGSDNNLVNQLFLHGKDKNFLGYAAWNTSANTVGSLLCFAKYAFLAEEFDLKSYNKLLAIRFLDDWAYQANIRQKIAEPCDINAYAEPYIAKVEEFLGVKLKDVSFSFIWNRIFETEVNLEIET